MIIYSMYIYMYYITVPNDVGRVNLTCDAVDLINQCTVTWNVSVHDCCIHFNILYNLYNIYEFHSQQMCMQMEMF